MLLAEALRKAVAAGEVAAARAPARTVAHVGQRFALGQSYLALVGVATGVHCGHAPFAHRR